MKIVIEISKEDYMYLKDAFESGDWEQQRIAEMNSAELLLHKGTILQGHGRLIDADMFLARNAYFADKDFINSKYGDTLKDLIDSALTIIEADKEDD
jgi:CTP:phosphocholine cytidylyltransferase-like protein